MGFQPVFASFSFVFLFMYPYGMEGMGAEGKGEKTKIIPEKTSMTYLQARANKPKATTNTMHPALHHSKGKIPSSFQKPRTQVRVV